jgi:hypothetical protein
LLPSPPASLVHYGTAGVVDDCFAFSYSLKAGGDVCSFFWNDLGFGSSAYLIICQTFPVSIYYRPYIFFPSIISLLLPSTFSKPFFFIPSKCLCFIIFYFLVRLLPTSTLFFSFSFSPFDSHHCIKYHLHICPFHLPYCHNSRCFISFTFSSPSSSPRCFIRSSVKGSYACITYLCFLVFFILFLLFSPMRYLSYICAHFSCAASCLYYDYDASGVLVGYYCMHTPQAYPFLTYLPNSSIRHTPSGPHAYCARMNQIFSSAASLLTTTHPRPFLACHRLPCIGLFSSFSSSTVHHRAIMVCNRMYKYLFFFLWVVFIFFFYFLYLD